jgi:ADP-heptose:LPS heptosyltransferase
VSAAPTPSFLVIRRDNIGDLVCTTPVFEALRRKFPGARILALTNSYNLPVLRGNPFIDEAFAYTKGKHREAGRSLWSVYADRVRLILRLRGMRIDYAIVASCGLVPRALAFARLVRPRHIVSHMPAGKSARGVDMPVPYDASKPVHEVQDVYTVLSPFGIAGEPPALTVVPRPEAQRALQAALEARGIRAPVGVHISARKASNRWPLEKTAALMRRLHARHGAAFVLFWSPGDESDPRHPGDDAKAAALLAELRDVPVLGHATHSLDDLVAGLSVCERVICSDGGAMHIAAALARPILCFFGKSDATRWRPWGVPYVLLQPPTLNAGDIAVEEAYEGFERLARIASSAPRTMPA